MSTVPGAHDSDDRGGSGPEAHGGAHCHGSARNHGLGRARANRRLAFSLLGVVATMGALAWAAVPFYDWFCRVTGYGGRPAASAEGADHILDETVIVRFDANIAQGMPWVFRPLETRMELRIGETGLAFYEAWNPTDRPVAGTASFNVAPEITGAYFGKIECFCFTEQVLGPGERVVMPVSFYVDPGLVADRDTRRIREITLSYTFHRTPLPEHAALPEAAAEAPG